MSLVPNFNRAMFESLKNALPAVPYVTILTDIADYPPHFWMEKQEQFLICGSDKAVAQARALGYTEDRIFRASGMILRPTLLSAGDCGSRRRAEAAGSGSGAANGPGAVRRARLEGDAGDRRAACRTRSSF